MSTSRFARHFFKAFDAPSDRNKKAKWITSSSSPLSPPAKIAEAVVATSLKAAREQDRPNGCWRATCVWTAVSTSLVNELLFLHYVTHRSTSASQ